MRRPILGILLGCLISVGPAWAVKVSGLYEAEMIVPSQSQDVRSEAIKKGFVKVLTKVTGNQDVEKNRRIRDDINRADYYVQEFSYSSPSMNRASYKLFVQFNQSDIKRLLNKAGLDYWGEMRPLILVWLVTIEDGNLHILGTDTPGNLLSTFKQEGERFGLPLIFPVMDIADMNLIGPESVRKADLERLRTAAVRYTPDALLIGTMQRGGNGYEAHWNLVLGEKVWDWSITASSEKSAIANILDDVSQVLSKRYEAAISDVPAKKINIEVTNIEDRSELVQVMRYLKKLTPVKNVELEQVNGDSVELSVMVRGDMSTLEENVTIGQKLMLKSQDAEQNKMVYEWIR